MSIPNSATRLSYSTAKLVIALVLSVIYIKSPIAQTQPLPAWSPDRACLQQIEAAGKECSSRQGAQAKSIPVLQQCLQETLTQDCRTQMNNAKQHLSQASAQCTEASQQLAQAIKTSCGPITNDNGHCLVRVTGEHKSQMEAACKGLR
jgi:hypothetical protein